VAWEPARASSIAADDPAGPVVGQLLLLAVVAAQTLAAQTALPTEWIDKDTSHRVVRLSREDGTQSLYFHQNAYTPDGKKLIVTTGTNGIATINLATREIQPLVSGPVSVLVAGHKSGDIYYTKRGQGGTGLGLHIVFNLVTAKLGGRIEASGLPGRGMRFSMRIPTTAPANND